MIDLTPIANAVISLLALLITAFLVPWLKAKVSAEKLSNIQKWAKIAVAAAEMIYKESGMGTLKKQYVTEYLKGKGYTLDVDTVDALIEAAVLEMNQNQPIAISVSESESGDADERN